MSRAMGCACSGLCRIPPYTCGWTPLDPWPGGAYPPNWQQPNPWPPVAPIPTVWPGVIPPATDQHVGNYQFIPLPTGCICPPGANRDCENPTCPRKNHLNPTPAPAGTSAAQQPEQKGPHHGFQPRF